jgi:hypothetical protein
MRHVVSLRVAPRTPPPAPLSLRASRSAPSRNPRGKGRSARGQSEWLLRGHRPLGPPGRVRRRPRAPAAGCAVLRLARPGGAARGACGGAWASARSYGKWLRQSRSSLCRGRERCGGRPCLADHGRWVGRPSRRPSSSGNDRAAWWPAACDARLRGGGRGHRRSANAASPPLRPEVH